MSLQLAAKHLASKGRGPDKQLVHMSPREVAGLQALAMAHGGSLTTNPDTGLPEAGFLDSLLPTIIGAGLMFATGGASAAAMPGLFGMGMPATIGLGIGALETARTGNLQKGLMAGLGAYGGAGLYGGLAGSAAAGPGMAVTNPAAPQIAAEQAAQAGVTGAAPVAYADPFAGEGINMFTLQHSPFIPELGYTDPAGIVPLESAPLNIYPEGSGFGFTEPMAGVKPLGRSPLPVSLADLAPSPTAAVPAAPAPATVPTAPAEALTNTPREAFRLNEIAERNASPTFAERFSAMPGKDLAKYGLAAAAPVLLAEPEYRQPELDREQYRYAYSPGPVMPPTRRGSVGEYTYFQPSFTRLAGGGTVENMSLSNVYDMQNARGGVTDLGVDMSTGMERMASGGITSLGGLAGFKGYGQQDEQHKYTYDPRTQTYAKVAPVIPLSAAEDALREVIAYGGGYDGGMSAGPGMGFGAESGQLGPGASAAEAAAIGAAMGDAGGVDGGGGLGGQGASGDTGGDGVGFAYGGLSALSQGGISHLGDYSDGGRLLKGPGDGVSDSIPAMIGRKQPARLADNEFVIPARIVSEIGNGSTDAGARRLYAMMDRVQQRRAKTVGKGKVAVDSKAYKEVDRL